MICHNVGVDIKQIEFDHFCPHFRNGGNLFISHKNHTTYVNRFGGGTILIPQSIQNIVRCLGNFQTPCISKLSVTLLQNMKLSKLLIF